MLGLEIEPWAPSSGPEKGREKMRRDENRQGGKTERGKGENGAWKGEELTFTHNPKNLHRKEKNISGIIIKDNLLNKLTILELISSQTANW